VGGKALALNVDVIWQLAVTPVVVKSKQGAPEENTECVCTGTCSTCDPGGLGAGDSCAESVVVVMELKKGATDVIDGPTRTWRAVSKTNFAYEINRRIRWLGDLAGGMDLISS
jgi:hypothetical protein